MSVNIINIETQAELESAFSASFVSPIVLFKHSTTCGISAGVLRYVCDLKGDIYVVTMQMHRPLAADIAERTGVRHESPQAIVLYRGEPLYAASHYDIDADRLQSYLDKSGAAD